MGRKGRGGAAGALRGGQISLAVTTDDRGGIALIGHGAWESMPDQSPSSRSALKVEEVEGLPANWPPSTGITVPVM